MKRVLPARIPEIKHIFSEALEEEVKKYYFKYIHPSDEYLSESTCITLWNEDGDALFCDKYLLLGNGNGTNNALDRVLGRNRPNRYSNVLVYGEDSKVLWLNIPHPDGVEHGTNDENSSCSFIEFTFQEDGSAADGEEKRYYREEILKSENFKKFALMFISNVAPQKLPFIQRILYE